MISETDLTDENFDLPKTRGCKTMEMDCKATRTYFQNASAAQKHCIYGKSTSFAPQLRNELSGICISGQSTRCIQPQLDGCERTFMVHCVRFYRDVPFKCNSLLCRPTACVTRWWVGRDNAILTEPT
jgi:hypothetical protein